ncbi:Cationic trypsin [Chlorella vulgaris]
MGRHPRLAPAALLLLLLALSTALAASSDPEFGVRIVGGTTTPVNRYPYFVSLRDSNGNAFCAGSLVAPDVVLTAAHCVSSPATKFPTVHIGRRYLTASETGYEVRRTITTVVHGSYDAASSANDIALLRLDSPSAKTQLALPQAQLTPANMSAVVVMGFGTTAEGSPYLSDTLQHVTIPYLDDATCQRIYPSQVKPGMVCAGDLSGGKDSCQGDSGGPLILPSVSGTASGDVQLGIVSWGYGCARAGLPAGDPCACAEDGISAGVLTGRKGCKQHGFPADRTWHCMTVGGMACPSAQPSKAFPGAAFLLCGRDAPAAPANPPLPPIVLVEGPGQITTESSDSSDGSQRAEAQSELCKCSKDGVSGGVATGRRGCAMHGAPTFLVRHCYVVGGTTCTAPGLNASTSFEGAAWKECRTSNE